MHGTHQDAGLARRGRIIALASVLAVVPMITGFPQAGSKPQPHPVKSHIHQLGFVASSPAAMRSAKNDSRSALSSTAAPNPILAARSGAASATQDVAGAVTVVGVTWPKGAVTAGDQFQIRTLTGSRWSQWQSLDEQSDGPDQAEAATARAATASASASPSIGGTGGTSPYIITGASKYQVRSLSTDPAVPTAARIQVVDPGTSSADSLQSAPGAAAAVTAMPTIHSRAAWGANESLRKAAPAYGKVLLAFVHHTDSSNSYVASDVPAMIRGMYAYHVQSLGWNDIGYNFLVDRFGEIWEGRYGGVTRPVVGAQTLNYNAVSTGVSAIGNFEATAVPPAMTSAFKRILAWKLSLTGLPATGTVVANGKSFQRISGHRDGFPTACPGQYLYAKLPEIRAGAAVLIAAQPPPVVTPPIVTPPIVTPPIVTPPVIVRSVITRDVDRNGAPDALSYSLGGTSIIGSGSLLASASRTPVRGAVTVASGWNALRNVSVTPDLNGDGKADIIAQDLQGNRLRFYLGNGRGGFAGVLYRGSGWNAMPRVFAAGDRDRDGRNDILAINAKGILIFYAGDGAGSVRFGRVISSGWNAFSSVTYAGDLNGDRYPDLLATRKIDGVQIMYAGAPGGLLRAGVTYGSGWGSLSPVVGGSDLDGDRYPDLYARSGAGMITYSSDASGRFVRSTRWGAGWGGLTQLSTGADWNGDGVADLLAINPAVRSGSLLLYAGTGKRDFQTLPAAFPSVAGANLVRLVGDVNGDHRTDAVARVLTTSTLVIRLGQAGSTFATPRQVGTTWKSLDLVEAAGDYTGDGVPDLLGRDSAGGLFVYPLSRDLTLKERITIGSGFQGMQSVVGVGAFNQDAYGDVIALRRSDHALLLFPGTGSGRLRGGSVLAGAQNDLAQILGVGDYNGDGMADLLARSGTASLWLYPGNGKGGMSLRQPVRGGEGAGHVLG